MPEFRNLKNLKFEFQIRTVLQHAWAELAHDRSYKFQGDLPQDIQRKLYLHAGILEIADKGFSEIAQEIDLYEKKITDHYNTGNLEIPIDPISINKYINSWASENEIKLQNIHPEARISDLIDELNYFEIDSIQDLENICPPRYADTFKKLRIKSNMLGIVRDWMIINSPQKALNGMDRNWGLIFSPDEKNNIQLYRELLNSEEFDIVHKHISDD